MSHLPIKKQIIVRTASDLSGTLDSTKVYLIDGVVDMGTTVIKVPTAGLAIQGLGFGVSQLISTENSYTMFTNDGVTAAGNLFINGCEFDVSGTSSKVFNLDNQGNAGAMEIDTVNFNNCTEIGTLTEYRQFLGVNVGFFSCTEGFTCADNWIGGFRLTTAIARNCGSMTIINAGTALVFNGRLLTDINLTGETNITLSDVSSTNIFNDGDYELIGGNYIGVTNPSPNLGSTNVKSRFRNNAGLTNTYVGGQWSLTTQAVTTIATVNTPVKIAGTTTYVDMQWFSNTTNNAFVFDSSNDVLVEIKGTLSFTGGNGDQINVIIRQWDNSAAGYINLSESGTFTMNAAGRGENVNILGYATLEENDRIEIWVENQTDTSAVTALLGGLVSIEERAS